MNNTTIETPREKATWKTTLRWISFFPAGFLGTTCVTLVKMAIERGVMFPLFDGMTFAYWNENPISLPFYIVYGLALVYAYYFVGVRVAPKKNKGFEILSLFLGLYAFNNLVGSIRLFFEEGVWMGFRQLSIGLIFLGSAIYVVAQVSSSNDEKITRLLRFLKIK